jgi:hypothetical protein
VSDKAGCETPFSSVLKGPLLEPLEQAGCETPLSSTSIPSTPHFCFHRRSFDLAAKIVSSAAAAALNSDAAVSRDVIETFASYKN